MRLRSRSGWGFQMGHQICGATVLCHTKVLIKDIILSTRVIIDVVTQLKCFIAGTG